MTRLSLLLAAACTALSCQLPFEQPSLPDPFVEQARIAFGGRSFTIFHVASHGLLRDRQFIKDQQDGVLMDPLPRQLAELLRVAGAEPLALAIGGAYSEKNRAVLEAALDLLGNMQLPGLELVFLGNERHAQALAVRLRARGASFRCVSTAD